MCAVCFTGLQVVPVAGAMLRAAYVGRAKPPPRPPAGSDDPDAADADDAAAAVPATWSPAVDQVESRSSHWAPVPQPRAERPPAEVEQ